MVKSIGFVYLLEVFEKKGDPVQKFTIDLKNGKGGIFKVRRESPMQPSRSATWMQ
jgi:hypothetical protein